MIQLDPLGVDTITSKALGSFGLDGYRIHVLYGGERTLWVYRDDGAVIQQVGVVRWDVSATSCLIVGNTLIAWVSPGSRRGDLLASRAMEVYRAVFGMADHPVSEVDEALSTGPREIEAPHTSPTREESSTAGGDVIEASFVNVGVTPPSDDDDGDQAAQSSGVDVASSSEADDNTRRHCGEDFRGVDAPVTASLDTPNSTTPDTTADPVPIVEFTSPRHRSGRRPSPYPAAIGIARVPVPVPNLGEQ